jgi:hypothetical protein
MSDNYKQPSKGIWKFALLLTFFFALTLVAGAAYHSHNSKNNSGIAFSQSGTSIVPDVRLSPDYTATGKPNCCQIRYYDKTLNQVKAGIAELKTEHPELATACDDGNTYYFDAMTGISYLTDETEFYDSSIINNGRCAQGCETWAYAYIDQLSYQKRKPTDYLLPFVGTANMLYDFANFIDVARGLDIATPGGYSVIISYPYDSHVYGTLGTYLFETPFSTNDDDYNPLATDDNPCDSPDPYAQQLFGGERGCSYMRCSQISIGNSAWEAPISSYLNETCALNPLFSYYIGTDKETKIDLYETQGIPTQIGCFPTTTKGVTVAVLRIVMGLAGIVALGIIVFGIISIMTQSDNPEKLKESYSRIIFAVIGLIVIILSVFILRFIGITVLNLPSFGGLVLEQAY